MARGTSSLQPIPYGPCRNGPVGNPAISQDHAAGKGAVSNES